MPHVGIERLGPGHRQHHAAQRDEGDEAVGREELQRVERIDRREDDGRVGSQVHHAKHREHAEIGQHHRSEQLAHTVRPARLDREQGEQNRDRGRHDPRLEAGDDVLEPLGRRKHRDRRGDHAVAIEQRGGEDAEQDQRAGPGLGRRGALDQRQQREAATLAAIIGAHDGDDIFDRHHHHHRPEDEAQHPVDVINIGRDAGRAVVRGEGFAEGIERAGADIAEHDSDRADRKRQGGAGMAVAVAMIRGGSGTGGVVGGGSCGAAHSNRISRIPPVLPKRGVRLARCKAARLAPHVRSRNMAPPIDT